MFQILAYIKYWLHQVEAHSLHSPFVFQFYNGLIKNNHEQDSEIEQLRVELLKDSTRISLVDLGAGSRISKTNQRSISSIAKNSASPSKFSAFLQKLISRYEFREIFELGTSLGLNTLYLSKDPHVNVTTFEGDPHLSEIAQRNFEGLGRANINLIQGNIDNTLANALADTHSIDLVYIDANHSYAPTLNYYQQLLPKMSSKGIMVFDDIHWSKEMNKAWNEIKSDNANTLTLDLFEAGLVFLDNSLPKENYVLKF